MRHARHPWQTLGLLVGGLCLGIFWITPIMAAPITYTFTGVVTGIDSALMSPMPLHSPSPLSKVPHSKRRFITQLVGSQRHTTNSVSLVQVQIGAYQVHVPFTARDQSNNIATPNFSKATYRSSTKDSLTLIPSSSVKPWLSHHSFEALGEPPAVFGTTALPERSELPPNIGSFFTSDQSRIPLISEAAPRNPVTIAQGTIASASAGPLPASLIIAGVGLVALIGLGAGGLRHN